jgi:hypothetical protein
VLMQVRLRFVSTFLFVVLAVAPAVASATSGFDGDWSYFELDDDGVRFHGVRYMERWLQSGSLVRHGKRSGAQRPTARSTLL